MEFLPLSERRVLAILVLNGQEVQNRIIQTRRPLRCRGIAKRAANYLNAQFGGRDIQQVRKTLLDELRETRDHLDRLMQTVMEMAEQTFETTPEGDDYVVAGQTHLMQYADLSDLDKLRQLFETFNQKSDLLHLFDQCLHAGGVQIFVGEESGCGVLEGCSVVTAPYGSGDRCWACSASSVRLAWPTTGSFRWWTSPLVCWPRCWTGNATECGETVVSVIGAL